MASIISHDADVTFGKPLWRIRFDFDRDFDFGTMSPLKFHNDGIENSIEGLNRPHHVDFNRTIEAFGFLRRV